MTKNYHKEGYDLGWDWTNSPMTTDNPYPKNSIAHKEWHRGFLDGNHDKDISLEDMRGGFDETSGDL